MKETLKPSVLCCEDGTTTILADLDKSEYYTLHGTGEVTSQLAAPELADLRRELCAAGLLTATSPKSMPNHLSCAVLLVVTWGLLRVVRLRRTLMMVRLLALWKAAVSTNTDLRVARALAARVRTAGALVPLPVRCLEQAVVVYWLLQRRGLRAEFRLGARLAPFGAHAWVEHDGTPLVVNAHELHHFAVFPEVAP